MQRQIFDSHRGRHGKLATRFGALLAMAGLFLLSACDGNNAVTENNLPEPGLDGVPPTLTTVTIQPDGFVELGQSVRIDIVASEALMKPIVTINSVRAEVTGRIGEWRAVREMTEADTVGEVYFSITYQDISGEAGLPANTTTNGSAAQYCAEDCPTGDLGPLEGKWKLDFAGVGPSQEDASSFFNISDTGPDGPRACWFDDLYEFGADGSFGNVQGGETWLEAWQSGVADACGVPVAPHDGSNNAIFEYDEDAGTLQLTGQGAHLGLPKVVNGGELAAPADAPDSVTYNVVELVGDSLTVQVDVGGAWWEFRLTRVSNLPIVGNWKLAFAGVGPSQEDASSFFNISDTGPDGPRACWFDDIYHFGDDGSFQNFQEGETWLEAWQSGVADACGTPVAPHDGSTVGAWIYDDVASTVTLDGLGSHLGLPKVVNGGELAAPADAPDSVTYNVVELVGDSLTVQVDVGGAWWEFRFERVADNAALKGNWKLDFAGVGPSQEDASSFFNISDTGPDGPRACWFDDLYEFGADGSFGNVQGGETWLEAWQSGVADACGVPVAPHDGSNNAIFEYDEDAGTLQLTSQGAHLGLPKVVNGGELAIPAAAPDSVTYNVVELVGDSLTVQVDVGGAWWEFRLTRVSNLPIVGNWKLAFAGVGPSQEDASSFFNISDTGPDGPRACWFDDIYHFGDDGSFQNFQEGETWLEAWQSGVADACGTPVAPHDGSTVGAWIYDDVASTVTLDGLGSHLGLPKVVNGGELAAPADAPDSVTYNVVELVGDSLTVQVDVGGAWWEFRLAKD